MPQSEFNATINTTINATKLIQNRSSPQYLDQAQKISKTTNHTKLVILPIKWLHLRHVSYCAIRSLRCASDGVRTSQSKSGIS